MSTTMLTGSIGRASDNAGWSRSPTLSRFPRVRASVAANLLWVGVVAMSGLQRASAQGCDWEQKFPDLSPSPRVENAMAYDSARRVIVLFGGEDDQGRDGETWEWDGSAWALQATTGPSPRQGHALAYDSARDVTVLFGGNDASGGNGETWEWDGATWALLTTTGPSARSLHALAYDSARGVTVLFGGLDSGYDGETWEWDGDTWTLRSTRGPSARYSHALAYDSARDRTVLFGGYDNSSRNGETWEWDGATWTLRATTGPSPREGHALAYDSARDVTVLFGGGDDEDRFDGETWEWNGATWALRVPTGPSPRYRHALAHDSARGVTVLFGGYDGSFEGDTWEDEFEPRVFTERFKVNVKEGRARCKIRASVLTTLREGTELAICFEDDGFCGCKPVVINDQGRAKATCITFIKGAHHVCIQGCPDLCRTVTCQP